MRRRLPGSVAAEPPVSRGVASSARRSSGAASPGAASSAAPSSGAASAGAASSGAPASGAASAAPLSRAPASVTALPLPQPQSRPARAAATTKVTACRTADQILVPGSLDVAPGGLDVVPGSLDVGPGRLDVGPGRLDVPVAIPVRSTPLGRLSAAYTHLSLTALPGPPRVPGDGPCRSPAWCLRLPRAPVCGPSLTRRTRMRTPVQSAGATLLTRRGPVKGKTGVSQRRSAGRRSKAGIRSRRLASPHRAAPRPRGKGRERRPGSTGWHTSRWR